MRFIAVVLVSGVMVSAAVGQTTRPSWSVETYPDETGFKKRVAPTIPLIAKQDCGKREMAPSTCPDTGLPVRSWALKGEEIVSPYTGRRYIQGDIGPHGPQHRDKDGRIDQFRGDPLKFDLPPATARLLLNPDDALIKAFLTIPGNTAQQYHFACVNWGRFYPLLADKMSPEWRAQFAAGVANYRESRKPSDHDQPLLPDNSHDLVGQENEPLGGDTVDGGTENHKQMWRTSGLLYSQILGPDAKVSFHTAGEAQRITHKVIAGFWRSALAVGNGEYDSPTYYPWDIRGYLNLFDFSPDAQTKQIGQFALDYYLATYGLKVFNGTLTGAQRRGWVGGPALEEMDTLMWMYSPRTTYAVPEQTVATIHQATTRYRPNRIIHNIITKNVPLPFEAQMSRPMYHMQEKNIFQETFYCDDAFAMGSVAMGMVDNPLQQTVWSLAARGPNGSIILGGGQPRFKSPEGHSPYDQVVQKRSAIILLTGQTGPEPDGKQTPEQAQRFRNAGEKLISLADDASVRERWEKAKQLGESWLYVPRTEAKTGEADGWIVLDAGDALVAIRPLGRSWAWLDGPVDGPADLKKILEKYRILSVRGEMTGFIIDAGAKVDHKGSLDRALRDLAKVDASKLFTEQTVSYRSILGDTIEMRYQPTGLRASATINGKAVDWSHWADGGVYDSPYVKLKDGVLRLSDGREGYEVNWPADAPAPVWKAR